jgi:hypothetical protein
MILMFSGVCGLSMQLSADQLVQLQTRSAIALCRKSTYVSLLLYLKVFSWWTDPDSHSVWPITPGLQLYPSLHPGMQSTFTHRKLTDT